MHNLHAVHVNRHKDESYFLTYLFDVLFLYTWYEPSFGIFTLHSFHFLTPHSPTFSYKRTSWKHKLCHLKKYHVYKFRRTRVPLNEINEHFIYHLQNWLAEWKKNGKTGTINLILSTSTVKNKFEGKRVTIKCKYLWLSFFEVRPGREIKMLFSKRSQKKNRFSRE